jgi:hypothetical protein
MRGALDLAEFFVVVYYVINEASRIQMPESVPQSIMDECKRVATEISANISYDPSKQVYNNKLNSQDPQLVIKSMLEFYQKESARQQFNITNELRRYHEPANPLVSALLQGRITGVQNNMIPTDSTANTGPVFVSSTSTATPFTSGTISPLQSMTQSQSQTVSNPIQLLSQTQHHQPFYHHLLSPQPAQFAPVPQQHAHVMFPLQSQHSFPITTVPQPSSFQSQTLSGQLDPIKLASISIPAIRPSPSPRAPQDTSSIDGRSTPPQSLSGPQLYPSQTDIPQPSHSPSAPQYRAETLLGPARQNQAPQGAGV